MTHLQKGKYPIYHVAFPTQYLITSTMLRMQEYYESPQFRGTIFDLEEYMDWYAKERGNFTYFQDWSGFNIPSWVLAPFYDGKFDPLSRKEIAFLDLLKVVQDTEKIFYVIATYGKASGAIDHEIVHGLYYCDAMYSNNVRQVFTEIPLHGMRKALMALQGYHEEVLLDEMNAYIMTGIDKKVCDGLGAEVRAEIGTAKRALGEVFEKCFGVRADLVEDMRAFQSRIHHLRFVCPSCPC